MITNFPRKGGGAMCDKEHGFPLSKKTKVNNRIKIFETLDLHFQVNMYLLTYHSYHIFQKCSF